MSSELTLTETDKKWKYSGWLLTVNSNQTEENLSMRDFKRKMIGFFRELFGGEATAFKHRFGRYDGTMIVNVNPHFEVGKKYHRLHCHAIVKVDHNSNIQLDRRALDAALPGYYFHWDFLRDSTAEINRILYYARKQYEDIYEEMDYKREAKKSTD